MQNNLKTLEAFIELKENRCKEHQLKVLMWEPTLVCNLECLHCSNGCTSDQSLKKEELSTKEIKNVLFNISKYYDAREIHFVVTGGEPLMRSDLCEVGKYAHDLGFKWSITTNAMLLTDIYLDALKEAKVERIAISLDGIESDHNRLRNNPHSFKKVMMALGRLKQRLFYTKLDILTCVSTINHNHLDAFIECLIELKIPSVRFIPLVKHGRAVVHEALALNAKELYALLLWIKKSRKKFQQYIDISLSDDGYYGPEFECHVRENLHYDAAGIEWASIMHNGDVTGATNISSAYKEGNIRQDSFVNIWENCFYRYREGRKNAFALQCDECEAWEICEGGGFHLLDEVKKGSTCRYYQIRGVIDEKNSK